MTKRKPREGEIVHIWFPNLTMNVKAAKEFGYPGRDRWGFPLEPVTEFKAEYYDGEWECKVGAWDETFYDKTIQGLIKQLKSFLKGDPTVSKIGRAEFE